MTVRILTGDCRDVLRTLPDESVHCVVTSPPYWGLRDYQTARWVGGDADCDHRSPTMREGRNEDRATLAGSVATNGAQLLLAARPGCGKCGAQRDDKQIGLEASPTAYVAEMVGVFREVRRVLHASGTCWVNLGDSYAGGGGGNYGSGISVGQGPKHTTSGSNKPKTPNGCKPKDLCGIPWRVAFALQEDGWWLRQDIIWAKPNPMPESVTDRCTKAHEYLFLLAKSERYYFDAEAIAEPASFAPSPDARPSGDYSEGSGRQDGGTHLSGGFRKKSNRLAEGAVRRSGGALSGGTNASSLGVPAESTRNKRSVWTVGTQPFSEAHFATFPPALIEPCIKAGCPKDCCAKCGAPWARSVEVESRANAPSCNGKYDGIGKHRTVSGGVSNDRRERTIGEIAPTCGCGSDSVRSVVLDPFGGAGTTGLVADRLGRNAILIELNESYVAIAKRRIETDGGMFAQVDLVGRAQNTQPHTLQQSVGECRDDLEPSLLAAVGGANA